MKYSLLIGNSLLWAAAIIAAAIAKVPPTVTTVILPSLAMIALILNERMVRNRSCVES